MRASIGTLVIALPLALVTLVATAQEKSGGNPEAAKLKNPVAATPESIAAGESFYNRRCRFCHGKDGTGGPPKEANDHPASNLVDAQWDHGSTDGEIFYTILMASGPVRHGTVGRSAQRDRYLERGELPAFDRQEIGPRRVHFRVLDKRSSEV